MDNIKFKVFVSYGYTDLERLINSWTKTNSSRIEILDFKFHDGDTGYSICLMYKEKDNA